MLKRFLHFYRPHWKLLALDLSMALLQAVCTLMMPMLVRGLLNDHLPQGRVDMMLWTIAALAGLIAVIGLTVYITMRWGHVLGTRMETDMRSDLFQHLQKLSFGYFDKTKTGHIMSRISNDLFMISEIAHHAPEDFFISACIIIGAFLFMFSFNVPLALLALAPLPPLLGWALVFGPRMRRRFRRVRRRIADINSNVENSIQGIREVKSYANEDHAIDRFQEVNTEFRMAKERMYGTMAGFHTGMRVMIESYWLVIIGGGTLLMHRGLVAMADVVAVLLYIRFIINPIQRLVHFVEQFQQGTAAFERFVEIMEDKPDIRDEPGTICCPPLKGKVELENVWFKYPESAAWVLRDISLTLPPGMTAALVGESGAGKSTLAALLPRFYEPQKGAVLIDGRPVRQYRQRSLRQQVGVVQQNVFLFDMSIRENIGFGRPEAGERELEEAADRAHILDFIRGLPDGFDSHVGEHGARLSGGQKQRISIARVFLKNPPILIFDEATSSLDTESEQLIQSALEELSRDRTTLIIAHRLSTVRGADRIFVLQRGQLVEQGTHAELSRRGGTYHNLYAHTLR